MHQSVGVALGAITVPALVLAMNATGGGGGTAGLVEYERISFELPDDWQYDRERPLRATLPGGGIFQFSPEDLSGRLDLPGPLEFDREITVDGTNGRDQAALRNGQYIRLVVLEEGGAFSIAVPESRRADADRALEEIIRSADTR